VSTVRHPLPEPIDFACDSGQLSNAMCKLYARRKSWFDMSRKCDAVESSTHTSMCGTALFGNAGLSSRNTTSKAPLAGGCQSVCRSPGSRSRSPTMAGCGIEREGLHRHLSRLLPHKLNDHLSDPALNPISSQ
jgi:hypothetical protein